jgi:hypothetical protein
MGNFSAPVNGDISSTAWVEQHREVREYLYAKHISLENVSFPSVLTEEEKHTISLGNSIRDRIYQELLKVVRPDTQLSTDHLELLDYMIYESADNCTNNVLNSKGPIFYREIAQIANFIKIHAEP